MDGPDDLTPPGKPPPTGGGLGSRPSSPSVGKVVGVTLWVLFGFYALGLVLTNRDPVDVSLVFRTVTMPLVLLLLLAFVLGGLLALGGLGIIRRLRRDR